MNNELYKEMDIRKDYLLEEPPEDASPDEIFLNISNYIRHYHPNMDLEKIKSAYELASKAHEGQKRKSGQPYIVHPLRVAWILATLELDKETIIAGLLHDVVEDTKYTLDDIRDMFGEDVAVLVDGVTKLGQVSIVRDKLEIQAENLRKMFLAMAKDIRVILIKLADRLHNMRTLNYMRREKQIEIAKETQDIYSPLAHRLGIFKIKIELDDLALKYLEPEIYNDLLNQLNQRSSSRQKYIENIVKEVNEHMKDAEINCKIYGRVKHLFSIYKKMVKQDKNLDQIYDLFAVRIIVKDIKNCYAALGIIHAIYTPLSNRFKDYIAVPKPNMYRSLHTTVIGDGKTLPFEIQIRTEEMHKTAEYGIAAHWVYKEGKSGVKQDKLDQKLSWLRQLLEWQQDMPNNLEFLTTVKDDLNLFSENIYCFTPNGDVKTLKAGSTPIDFAYSIHSAVGNKMVGARVNSKMVPINTKLKNGDMVEIITSQNTRGPSLDWLNIIATSQAKNKISQWFKKTNKEENINKGKELINIYAKTHNYVLSDLLQPKYLKHLYTRYNLQDWDSILAAVGHGGLKEGAVFSKLLEEYKKDIKTKEVPDKEVLDNVRKKKKHIAKNDSNITVKGVDDISVRLSKCCNPVPGDEIIGFITRGRGVSVHRSDCVNVINISDFDKDRLIETEWNVDIEKAESNFVANVDIYMMNKKGMLTNVTKLLSENDIDIVSMNVRTSKNGGAAIEAQFYIDNVGGLNKIIDKLRKIPDVIDVKRVG